MAIPPLSLRAYAAHRRAQGLPGGSLQAVQRAVRAERITVVDGRIPDPEAADREWAANTDHSRAPGYVKDWADPDEDLETDDDPDAPSLARESARLKREQRIAAELKNRREAGELVKAADVEAEVAETFSTVRTRVLGVTAKLKQRRPHLQIDDLAELDELLREALAALAESNEEAA